MLIAGIDSGNSTVILSMEGLEGENSIIIPTVYASYKNYDMGLNNPKSQLINSLDVDVILNTDDNTTMRTLGRFFVGQLARTIEKEQAKIREIGKTKVDDAGLLICMLTSLAYGVIINNKKNFGHIKESLKVVSGLPYLHYKPHKEDFKRQILGHHSVKFNGDYTIQVDLDIEEVSIECEGAEALKKSLFNNQGKYKYTDDQLVDKTIIGIDIGEFTTEIIAITFIEENNEIVPKFHKKLCDGIEIAIANAKQPIVDILREKYNTIIDRYTIDKVINRKHRKGEIDLENGSSYNIINDYNYYLKDVAEKIAVTINNKVKVNNEKGKILEVTGFGGGAEILGQYLKQNLESMLNTSVNVADNSLTANADAYLEKAKALYGR